MLKTYMMLQEKVIEYIQKENVLTQTKVAKNMRNDVLVVRVANGEEAKK